MLYNLHDIIVLTPQMVLKRNLTNWSVGFAGPKPLLPYHSGQIGLVRGEWEGEVVLQVMVNNLNHISHGEQLSQTTQWEPIISESGLPQVCYFFIRCVLEHVKGLLQMFPKSRSVKKLNCVQATPGCLCLQLQRD